MSRTTYQYCPVQQKVVPRREVIREDPKSAFVIDDTMADTKSPIDSKLWFNSKSAIRQHYKQHGMEEVGTSYDKGVDPWESEVRDTERATDKKIKQRLIEKFYENRR